MPDVERSEDWAGMNQTVTPLAEARPLVGRPSSSPCAAVGGYGAEDPGSAYTARRILRGQRGFPPPLGSFPTLRPTRARRHPTR
jgi:hypothetical protein